MSVMIHVNDVSVVTSGRERLASIALDVNNGEIVGLIGPNGSGKSTLLAVMSGELAPTSGTVSVSDTYIQATKPIVRARMRAVLGQENPSIFSFRVQDVVAWGRHCWRGRPESEHDDEVIAEAMDQFEVAGLADRVLTQLSGGERARVHLARVAAQRAPLLLLDEADSHLDLVGRSHVDSLIRAHQNRGGTCVVISHDLPRMAAVADRLVIVGAGRVLTAGPARETFTASWIARAYGVSEDQAAQLLNLAP